MKRLSMTLGFVTLAVALALGQGMMTGSTTMSDSPKASDGAGSMMAPAQPSSGTTMMAAIATADPAVGNKLRFAASTGKKLIFTNLMAAQRIAAKGPVVLFFAADWCPSCQADLRDINANGSRLGATTVVVLDYDKAADLKTRYGVTAQDTFVQIDAKGAKLAVWNGGGVDGILGHLAHTM